MSSKIAQSPTAVKTCGLQIIVGEQERTAVYLLANDVTRWSHTAGDHVPSIRYIEISKTTGRLLLAAIRALHGDDAIGHSRIGDEAFVNWPTTAVTLPTADAATGDALAATLFAGERIAADVEVR